MVNGLILSFAILALSQAGNIIRLCETTPFVVAFYRLIMALFILYPISAVRSKQLVPTFTKKNLLIAILMGILFAAHFFAWIASIQMTKVANAAICFSVNPIFIALGAHYVFKEQLPKHLPITIALGIVGVIFVGGDDLSLDPKYFIGDLLSILAALCFAVYFLIGKSLRKDHSNSSLMSVVYLSGAIFSFIMILIFDSDYQNINQKTWWALLALAIFPTILGHASMIYVLKVFRASVVGTLTLIEPILAGIVAWILFGEKLSGFSLLGYSIMLVGLVILANENSSATKWFGRSIKKFWP